MQKFNFIVSSIMLWMFIPLVLMTINLSGFTELNTEIIEDIDNPEFNFITLQGFSTFIRFMLQLGTFSISGLNIWFQVGIGAIGIGNLIAFFFVLRGTN